MDIIEYLEAEQDALRALIIEWKIADEESTHEAEAFTALVSTAKAQADAGIAFVESLKTSDARFETVAQALTERIEGAREVERIIECCTNRATWRSSILVYCEMLEAMLELESRTFLPALFEIYPSEFRQKLGSKYRGWRGFGRKKSVSGEKSWSALWKEVLTEAG